MNGPMKSLFPDQSTFLVAGAVFLGCGMLVILFVLASRVIKTIALKKKNTLRDNFQKSINGLIILLSTSRVPEPSYRYHIKKLNHDIRRPFAKQVMVDQLIAIKKNLTGESAKAVDLLYVHLGLKGFSMRKIKSMSSVTRAEGIRELAELNCYQALPMILSFLHATDKTLREEAFMAVVRMHNGNILGFLDHYRKAITPWMKMIIHHHLTLMDGRKLPLFSKWFTSPNPDVVLFSISMAAHFRQVTTVPQLIALLKHKNTRIVSQAIETLGRLETETVADSLLSISGRYWTNEKISAQIVRSLGQTAYKEEHNRALSKYVSHPGHTVRTHALKALVRNGVKPDDIINTVELSERKTVTAILEHITEPLLNY